MGDQCCFIEPSMDSCRLKYVVTSLLGCSWYVNCQLFCTLAVPYGLPAVMCPDSSVDFSTIHIVCLLTQLPYLLFLLSYLSTSLRIGPFHFQARCCTKPRDWLRRLSPKWPVSCAMQNSISQSVCSGWWQCASWWERQGRLAPLLHLITSLLM